MTVVLSATQSKQSALQKKTELDTLKKLWDLT